MTSFSNHIKWTFFSTNDIFGRCGWCVRKKQQHILPTAVRTLLNRLRTTFNCQQNLGCRLRFSDDLCLWCDLILTILKYVLPLVHRSSVIVVRFQRLLGYSRNFVIFILWISSSKEQPVASNDCTLENKFFKIFARPAGPARSANKH